jgi:ubiquinone/menaquinone biosynthesis C-methylase UbiE
MADAMLQVKADFDRIALLSDDTWGHNQHYHGFLLEQLPVRCSEGLDIGCGTGAFSRLLAERSDRVVALDLSPEMIRIAQQRSKLYTNIDFRVADATTWQFPVEQFDCVVSIATMHHLPFETTLAKMSRALRGGGVLLILDLFEGEGMADAFTSLFAVAVSAWLRLTKTGRLRAPSAVRQAWAEHGRHDSYLTLSQIQKGCVSILPGACVKKHLLWRYSIVWTKPGRLV